MRWKVGASGDGRELVEPMLLCFETALSDRPQKPKHTSKMVAQRELEERLRAVDAQLQVEERDWHDEERKLFELEETYLRETVAHGNVFTGWGEAKTAGVRFRNAALRKKKRERQDPLLAAVPPTLSAEEQLKVDKNRLASYSSITSPAEAIRDTLEARQKKMDEKANTAGASSSASPKATSAATPSTKPNPKKKARK